MKPDSRILSSVLDFSLPEWDSEKDFKAYETAQTKLSNIAEKAGKSSHQFRASCEKLRAAVMDEARQGFIIRHLSSSIDVRAFTSLLAGDEDFGGRCVVDNDLWQKLESLRPNGLGLLNVTNLLGAYFSQYDNLKRASLNSFSEILSKHLGQYSGRGISEDQKKIRAFKKQLFRADAPKRLAGDAIKQGKKVEEVCRDKGLGAYPDGRFQQICRFAYYIEQLRTIPAGSDRPILKYVVEPDVCEVSANDEQLFGHQILEILIDRSPESEISEPWRDVIMKIAGDPRVPTSDPQYMKWWQMLGEPRIAKMRAWLSGFDLRLFLRVLETSARNMNHTERERMFESRKVFMKGLYEQKLIKHARLFLCRHDEDYLKRNYEADTMPGFARVASGDTSMIYLNIDNKLHIIEGTHNFRVKIMDRLPQRAEVTSYEKSQFDDDELRERIKWKYDNEYPDYSGYLDTPHDHKHLNWQHKLLGFMYRHGVKVPEQAVLSLEHYNKYRDKFGLRI